MMPGRAAPPMYLAGTRQGVTLLMSALGHAPGIEPRLLAPLYISTTAIILVGHALLAR